MKRCPNCGTPFDVRERRGGMPRKYCSTRCRKTAQRRRAADRTETALEAAAAGQRGPWTESGIEAFVGQLMGEEAA